jgi:hypothetical protein
MHTFLVTCETCWVQFSKPWASPALGFHLQRLHDGQGDENSPKGFSEKLKEVD